ncbi:ABC transporter substrate-binding protein [Pseudomonas sp. KFB-139]|uniref:ABC transporter substrate-binding protein n=1 Tax=Pseudomonas serbiensis TaxID=3064350 RepID=A0ABT9CUY0_9PSED|nr:ABC transporter substrate-binding protein [Pseudomonas sp. KFB-138]MDO7929295.1 ABC transporter substrate-binding protein [Pseudomonas sp. KFB-138]
MSLRRSTGHLCALIVALISIAACSPSNESNDKVLNVTFFADNTILVSVDPFQVYWLEHRVMLRNVAESLTDQEPSSGQIIPWLAKRWEISDDGLAYTFYLRDDVTFSNGERFNAKAVKTAFDSNKALVEKLPSTFGATYLSGYDHAQVIDDFTVKLVLSKPNAGFLQATSTTILAILAPASYALTERERSLGQIIGTGPFVLDSYTPETGAKLSKRHGYHWASANSRNQGDAYLDTVNITYTPEESVRNGLFLQGKVDILWPRLPFSEINANLFEKKGATIQTRSLPGPALNLYPNVSAQRILSDRKVRIALQKSIDRKSFAQVVFSPTFPVVSGVLDVTTPYYKSQSQKLAYDPDGAADLLDQAGWIKADDGFRYKDGKRLRLVYNISPAETPGDILIQDQLRKTGIDLNLNVLTRADWSARNGAGNYDLTAVYMTRADPIILQTILDPRTAYSAAVATNIYEPQTLPKARELFDAGVTSIAPEKREQAYGALQDLLIDEAATFPLHERLLQAATSSRVKNFHWTAEGIALFGDIQLTGK